LTPLSLAVARNRRPENSKAMLFHGSSLNGTNVNSRRCNLRNCVAKKTEPALKGPNGLSADGLWFSPFRAEGDCVPRFCSVGWRLRLFTLFPFGEWDVIDPSFLHQTQALEYGRPTDNSNKARAAREPPLHNTPAGQGRTRTFAPTQPSGVHIATRLCQGIAPFDRYGACNMPHRYLIVSVFVAGADQSPSSSMTLKEIVCLPTRRVLQ